MARILAISSLVARGHVGLPAIVPALQRLRHEVIALPTVVLSNHPGHASHAGAEIETERLRAMLDALENNGWLAGTHAILTGYLPTVEHVRFAAEAASRISAASPSVVFYCDPIFGDDPGGLYLDEDVARAIRDELLPLADMAFPNRFELAWLSGQTVCDVAAAFAAANELATQSVLATSIPCGPRELANLWVSEGEGIVCRVPLLAGVPHGTGDLLAGLFVGHRLNGGLGTEHLGRAVAGVAAALAASKGHDELQLFDKPELWSDAIPLPTLPL